MTTGEIVFFGSNTGSTGDHGLTIRTHINKGHIVFGNRQFLPGLSQIPGTQQAILLAGKVQGIVIRRIDQQTLAGASSRPVAVDCCRDVLISKGISAVVGNAEQTGILVATSAGDIEEIGIVRIYGYSDGKGLIDLCGPDMFHKTDPFTGDIVVTVSTADIRTQIQQILFRRMIQKAGDISAARDRTVMVIIRDCFSDSVH